MRRFPFFRCMAGVILGLVLSLVLAVPGVQAETKVLSKDTKLHPQGWAVGDLPEFKKGTTLTTNDLGEVISGTLAEDTFLHPRGWERVINDYYYVSAYADINPFFPRFHRAFVERSYNMAIPGYGHLLYKGGTPVTFSEQGDVLSGTIAERATVRLVERKYGFLTFKENTVLSFYDSGAVLSGVLAEDTNLRPVGWNTNHSGGDSAGFVKFSTKKAIEFNKNGEVIAGTLKETVKWRSTEGETVEFPANAAVRFNEQGATVEKASS
jgi:hypothetical protein